MSHSPERKEKNCLNCGAEVIGRFCHVCGQENVTTHQGFWALAKHFVYDVLHFDGKFFHTVLYLFTRPGFVAKKYVEGKRMQYLDPIRMYLFTSAVFFLVFFSADRIHIDSTTTLDRKSQNQLAQKWAKQLELHPKDTALKNKLRLAQDTSKPFVWHYTEQDADIIQFDSSADDAMTEAEYMRTQDSLPPKEKDGWIERRFKHQKFHLDEKYGKGSGQVKPLFESFAHKFPYILFISLPFFAGILKLLYVRRKDFYYSEHAVFTLYHYILSFIFILLMLGFQKLQDLSGWKGFGVFTGAAVLTWIVYLVLEMKNFYRQGWGKTIGKFILLNVLGGIAILILFVLFLFLALFQL